jgi:hypothetical protein
MDHRLGIDTGQWIRGNEGYCAGYIGGSQFRSHLIHIDLQRCKFYLMGRVVGETSPQTAMRSSHNGVSIGIWDGFPILSWSVSSYFPFERYLFPTNG